MHGLSEEAWNATPEELNVLVAEMAGASARLRSAAARRYASAEAWTAWETAATAARQIRGRLYGGASFEGRIAEIRSGDEAAVDRALTILEVDPWCHGSGYVKERLISALKVAGMSPDQLNRLRSMFYQVARDPRNRRELSDWCRLARRRLDVDELKRAFAGDLTSKDEHRRDRARWLIWKLGDGGVRAHGLREMGLRARGR